jgi:hypothetical protein
MQDFPETPAENMGGMGTFLYVPTHDIDTIPYTFGDTLTEPVGLLTGKAWYQGRALPGTLSLGESLNSDGTYAYTLSGTTTGTDAGIVSLFDQLRRREHIVDCTDRNGNRRLLGTNAYGAAFTWSHATAQAPGGLKSFSFSFALDMAEPAKIYRPG